MYIVEHAEIFFFRVIPKILCLWNESISAISLFVLHGLFLSETNVTYVYIALYYMMNNYARFNHSSYDITKLFEVVRFSENISIFITHKTKVTKQH